MIMEDEELKYFSKKMCRAIEEQTDINNSLTNKIQNSLQKDVTTQNEVKNIIDKHIIHKIGSWMPLILTAIAQVIVGLVIYYLK
jgi:uncharacterized protein YllA (UPF0747 family)